MIPWAELKCIAIFPMQVYLSDDANTVYQNRIYLNFQRVWQTFWDTTLR